VLNRNQALQLIAEHGVVLEAARGPVPSLARLALGDLKRSWWAHPRGKEFFRLTRALRSAPELLVCRLVSGKVTYVHERLWPALARLAVQLGPAAIAAIREVHTPSGRHRLEVTPFHQWAAPSILEAARELSEEQALAVLGPWATALCHIAPGSGTA
jgi:hypothetical protein